MNKGGDHGLVAPNKVAEFKLLSSTTRRVKKVDRTFQVAIGREARRWRVVADQRELVRKISLPSTCVITPNEISLEPTKACMQHQQDVNPASSDHLYSIEISEDPSTHSSTGGETKSHGGHRRVGE